MNKKWECLEADDEKVKKISKEYNISSLLAKILVNKNILEKEEIDLFLKPTRHDFHDPFLMPDMEIAAIRIIEAIENKEKMLIYGDYDVDGITSITVLKKFLLERGAIVSEYIPNRLDEGYGLNKDALKKIVENRKYFNDYSGLWNFSNRRNRICKYFRIRDYCNRPS